MAASILVLIVADGDVDPVLLRERLTAAERPVVIAADGGATHVLDAGFRPDLVVGDFDSLPAARRRELEAAGVELRVAHPDKDESDMELCLVSALERDPRAIAIVGALGLVRPEHGLANVLLLADPRLDGRAVAIETRGSLIRRCGTAAGPGAIVIEGAVGDFISLLPLGDEVAGVTTDGLRFPLADATLPLGPSRGLSNELLGRRARVTTRRGRLLVIHTRRSMADAPATGGD
jgi:thiamine pyrophosphokinase